MKKKYITPMSLIVGLDTSAVAICTTQKEDPSNPITNPDEGNMNMNGRAAKVRVFSNSEINFNEPKESVF